jgi:protein ImuB
MSRIASVWLKAWPIARLLLSQRSAARAEKVAAQRPLVLVAPGKGGSRITALNRAARTGGIRIGDLLSNARSKVLELQALDADPVADAVALRRLAVWGLRYTPIAAPWDDRSGADGFFLDISGCAHLFGGEEGLLDDLAQRLHRFGLAPRLAIADTAGASWAMARYGSGDRTIVRPGAQSEALADRPIAALRLCDEAQSLLLRLGFRHIRQLLVQPRAPFAMRFEGDLLRRLDQALGREPEPLVPVAAPPLYRMQAAFLEPIVSQEHIVEGAARLLRQLAARLARDDVGARVLRLLLFRVDGHVLSLDLGLASPSRDAAHLARLIGLRLERLDSGLDAAFGFEAAAVHVLVAEPLPARQTVLPMAAARAEPDGLARLIDRLQQRLGSQAVRQLHARQSHIPERAEEARPAAPGAHGKDVPNGGQAPEAAGENGPTACRPMLLLVQPEPAHIIALLPEGPPRQFRWRGVTHQVTGAEGPERIMPEWWRTAEAERDYYVVEDAQGRRFWLYREGAYGGGTCPKWFVHGMFA